VVAPAASSLARIGHLDLLEAVRHHDRHSLSIQIRHSGLFPVWTPKCDE
jgi:hypothetical protein